jgi:hypothetical protein
LLPASFVTGYAWYYFVNKFTKETEVIGEELAMNVDCQKVVHCKGGSLIVA